MTTTARVLESPDLAGIPVTSVLFALSDPARLDLVRQLAERGPQTVADCHVGDDGMPKSTLSHHLRALRTAGVIHNEPAGRQRVLTLRRAELDARFPGLLDAVLTGGTR